MCIGSSIAPVLSDIYLASLDKCLEKKLPDHGVVKALRYVDDYLVFVSTTHETNLQNRANEIVQQFISASDGLNFTHELPQNNRLQFLDLNLTLTTNHICWQYEPRSKEGLLQFESAHSKLVKRGIVMNCCHSAISKSCQHKQSESFKAQVSRLQLAGYPSFFVANVCESLLQKTKRASKAKELPEDKIKNPHVMPYIHRVSHNIKKVASRYNVRVVFSAPCKLSKLCPIMSKRKKKACEKRHEKRYTKCVSGVVYKIPLTCKKVYIGQTGRCFNERAREHNLAVKNKSGGHLAMHCKTCGCVPQLADTEFLARAKDKTEREIIEAYKIREHGEDCVSVPSVCLLPSELAFLQGHI